MSMCEEALRCPITGATDNLLQCRVVSESADADESQIACMEWVFGLPRGGLSYYLQSQENTIWFREDICRMYSRMEFLLVPTFKTFIDAMAFMQHAGVTARKNNDESPRRPLTALASNRASYRYTFIAFTEAARGLQKEFKMQSPTMEDLNNNWHPLLEKPLLEGSDTYPVLECFSHPFCISTFAEKAFWRRRKTEVTAQWHVCCDELVDQWRLERIPPPQWFIDAPKLGQDDTDLSATEASGYNPLTSEDTVAPDQGGAIGATDTPHPRMKVSSWLGKVDLTIEPIEEEAPPSPRKLRRSSRIAALSSPYASSPELCAPASPVRHAPWPSTRGRNPVRYPPAWVKRNGCFPTNRFSSNDWAYFQYGIALAARADR
ncbi:hypothetical protein BD626DRAFT_631812 [Schizophyllum amplum]|uniref:Uncharacterized protein n=1 Tax=Schizophyllum amplum TaxID=97359 RepID=A0A550C8Z3_9AGAR|nr:hypothetical protein BD626DRAFT_631812 [Auriculariopsis ampla]